MMPVKLLASFVQEGMFVGFCHSDEMVSELKELCVHHQNPRCLQGPCATRVWPGSVNRKRRCLGTCVHCSFSLVEKNITLKAINHTKIRFYYYFKVKYWSLFTCKIARGLAEGLMHFGTLQTRKLVIAHICGASVCQYDLFAQNKIFSRAQEIKTKFPFLKVIWELAYITELKLHRFSSRVRIKFSKSPLICEESKPYGNVPNSPGCFWHFYP